MLLFFIVCSLAVGWLLGGKLSCFEQVKLTWLGLPPLSMLLRFAVEGLPGLFFAPWFLTCSYLLLFLFLFRNRHLVLPSLFLGLGSLLNFTVIAVNGFAMPVARSALAALSDSGAAALLNGEIPMYRLADSAAKLPWLGDIFWFPIPFFQGFASIGDVFLALGFFLLLMAVMKPKRLFRKKQKEDYPVSPLPKNIHK